MSNRKNANITETLSAKSERDKRSIVKQAYSKASQLMNDSGDGLKSDVKVAIDPKLPFMGYSMPLDQGYRIVVSGGSIDSGLLEGLLVHEMSHIYRMENHHPSHDAEIIEEAITKFAPAISADYQQKVIHDILNDIQDLYADDISMKVLKKSQFYQSAQMTSFLQDWVKELPFETDDQRRDRWMNASILVHNARAIGQMTRHHIEDTNKNAVEANKRFLSQMPSEASGAFTYFRDLMINLKESMTRDEYRLLLGAYLTRFLEIAEKN